MNEVNMFLGVLVEYIGYFLLGYSWARKWDIVEGLSYGIIGMGMVMYFLLPAPQGSISENDLGIIGSIVMLIIGISSVIGMMAIGYVIGKLFDGGDEK